VCGCGGGACIPQRRYDQDPTLHPQEQQKILFSVDGKCGYLLEDALRKQYNGLDGRDDNVFGDLGSTANIRLEVRPGVSVIR